MGWLFSIIRGVAKAGVVLLGVLFLRNVSAVLLAYLPLPAPLVELALAIATLCYLVAFAVLVFGHSLEGMKWPVLVGFGVIGVVLLAGSFTVLVILVQTSPNLAVLLVADLVFAIILALFTDLGWLRALDLLDRSCYTAAIEVHPTELDKREASRTRFRCILSALALADVPIGFRFQSFPDGHARLFLFTWALDEALLRYRQTQLHQLLATHLSDVTLSSCELPPVPLPSQLPFASTCLTGNPGDAADGFAALQDALTKPSVRNAAVLFQVAATPAHLGVLDEWVTRRRVERRAKLAAHLLATAALVTQGVPPPLQEAEALSKPASVARAQAVLRQLRRFRAPDLLETHVTLVAWHPTSQARSLAVGKRLAGHLASALQGATPGLSVTCHTVWQPLVRRQIRRLLRGVPAGPSSYLLPAEAAAYVGIPSSVPY
jgi:hypothetical protein